ncbi:MAG: helix-turn-helix transcriptional regulator [Tetrasphaera jenkinsii]|uniref:Transcriptional regulator n=1 Tax=Nostocoides jenkinsii Ben 74 TaxID=1193518 RepID=A0A077MDT8_9MICO|nr:helix-turn-helix domain-containing protein [Tetrasphaera jenkinsii]MCI1262992.1 helix-turn-helix transcriptional regulator [Tetrasphaera jenkinsii]CCI54080.1 Transcriptional regulator [Tetrasphaera jenkinsii Ben 74]
MAKAMEILDERWTMLVIRELLMGSRHFNELRRGVPRMSPALLSKRLRALERHGIVTRRLEAQRSIYELTPCGADLFGIVNGLGVWALTWFPELGDDDLDPHLLMFDMRRTIPVQAWPSGRTVVEIRFTDVEPRNGRWWVVVTDENADICSDDPGHPVAVVVTTTLRTMTSLWRGDLSWTAALRSGLVAAEGASGHRRCLGAWFGYSQVAQSAGRPSTDPVRSAAALRA